MKLPLILDKFDRALRSPFTLYLSLALALVWVLVITGLAYSGKRTTFDIEPQHVWHDSGCAYAVMLGHAPKPRAFLQYVPDTLADKSASTLVLSENGVPIGHPHALHDFIRAEGGGQYSHWYGGLFFSAPDCSDPRSNGRDYSVSIEPSLRTWAKLSLVAAFLLVHFALLSRFGERLFYLRWLAVGRSFAVSALTPGQSKSLSGWGLLGIAILVWAGALIYLAETWLVGAPLELSLGSAYQFSDAYGYWICANEILNNHLVTASNWYEWCQRRLIYPTLLSGVLRISDQNIHQTLLIQAALLSLTVTILANRVNRLFGVLTSALTLVLLFGYAAHDAFGLTMTENAGLMFGTLALSFLFIACQKRSLPWVCAGLALLSIALSARAGAFFVLPLLLLWTTAVAKAWQKSVLNWLMAAGAALTIGFILQALLILLTGGSITGSNGNFSYTLYGLSVGGLGWGQVLTDHPYLTSLGSDRAMAQEIYRLAIANITSNPRLFFAGLYKGWLIFVSEGTYGYQRLDSFAPIMNALWWIGGGFLIYRWRDPRYLLLLAFAGGTLLSVPWLRADGGPRVFAATIAADVIQIGVGITCLSMLVLLGVARFRTHCQTSSRVDAPLHVTRHTIEFIAVFLLGGLLFTCLLPAPTRKPTASPDAFTCAKGDYSVVTRLGYNGTYLLDLVDGSKPDRLKGEVRRSELLQGIPNDAWWWTPAPPTPYAVY